MTTLLKSIPAADRFATLRRRVANTAATLPTEISAEHDIEFFSDTSKNYEQTASKITRWFLVFEVCASTTADLPNIQFGRTIEFLNILYKINKPNEPDEAIDIALAHFDDLLIEKKFLECNFDLAKVDVRQISPSVIISILGITRKARHILPSRKSFYDRAYSEIKRQKGWWYARRLMRKYH